MKIDRIPGRLSMNRLMLRQDLDCADPLAIHRSSSALFILWWNDVKAALKRRSPNAVASTNALCRSWSQGVISQSCRLPMRGPSGPRSGVLGNSEAFQAAGSGDFLSCHVFGLLCADFWLNWAGVMHRYLNSTGPAIKLFFLLLLAGCATSLECVAAPPASPAAAADRKFTYVIVPGAWGGGWAFKEVDRRLTADGHKVYRPTLTGQGEKVHLAKTLSEPISLKHQEAVKRIPTTYILTVDKGREPQQDDFYRFYQRAKTRGWTAPTMEGDHNVQWSHPAELVEFLEKAP